MNRTRAVEMRLRKFALLTLLAIASVGAGTGCQGWIPSDRDVALRSSPAKMLRVTNATTQPFTLLPAADRPDEAPIQIEPGQNQTIQFGIYRVIRAELLQSTPHGWRTDVADEARIVLIAEGSGHYIDMDGPEAAVRIKIPGGDIWRVRIALNECLFSTSDEPLELKISKPPSILVPVELCTDP